MHLFGGVEEVVSLRNLSRGFAPDSEGGMETKANPHSQGDAECDFVHVFYCRYVNVCTFIVFSPFICRRDPSLRWRVVLTMKIT